MTPEEIKQLEEIRKYCETYSGSSDVVKIEFLLKLLDTASYKGEELCVHLGNAMMRLHEAKEVLEFYAAEDNYFSSEQDRELAPGFGTYSIFVSDVSEDEGTRARGLLEKWK